MRCRSVFGPILIQIARKFDRQTVAAILKRRSTFIVPAKLMSKNFDSDSERHCERGVTLLAVIGFGGVM